MLTPAALLTTLLSIESSLGRRRKEKWAARTIDLDVLFYGDEVLHTADLSVPHPSIPWRRFTLIPLTELAPDFVHPILKKSMRRLLEECEDPLDVVKQENAT